MAHRLLPRLASALLALGAACAQPPPPAPVIPDASQPPPPPEVTLLITGDEGGWLVASGETGHEQGGAAETLGRWAKEGHCDGPVTAAGEPACPDDPTLALSTGDHGPGQALNARFGGEPMAKVMAQMGYAASVLGRHDLDLGKDAFAKQRSAGAFPYLGANVKAKDSNAKDFDFAEVKVFTRRGIGVAVVGLSNVHATEGGKFPGLSVEPYENALIHAVPKAWSAGAKAVVVLADACPADLKPVVDRHPDWKLTLVAAGHCAAQDDAKSGKVPVVYSGQRFHQYVSAHLSFDAKGALKDVAVKHVQVAGGKDAPYPNTSLAISLDGWRKKLDAQLNKPIGFTKTGFPEGDPKLAKWFLSAWKEAFKADVAVSNAQTIEGGLSPGDVTEASVYQVAPKEEALLLVKVKGADLTRELENSHAVMAGATRAGKKVKDAKGKPLDSKKLYTVVLSDGVYGGQGFHFDKDDPRAQETGVTLQTPVIEKTRKMKTSKASPLEKALK